MKISEAIDVFIEHVCAGKKNETPAAYRTKLHQLVVRMGDRVIDTVTTNDLDDFRVSLLNQEQKMFGKRVIKEPLTASYIRGVLKTVKHLFSWLCDTGRLSMDPSTQLEVPKRPKPDPKAVESEVVDKMSAAAAVVGAEWEQVRNMAMLSLLRNSGARIGGLLAATVPGTDVEGGVITTTEKGGRKKRLYLKEAAREPLRRWLAIRAQLNPKDDKLFIGQSGRGLTRSGAEKIWNRLAEAAGVEDQRHNFHSFRHAFARDSIRAGADLSHVSQLMGHSSTAITSDYYLQYTHDELQEVHTRVSPSVPSIEASADSQMLREHSEVIGGEKTVSPSRVTMWSDATEAAKSAQHGAPMVIFAVGPLNPSLMNKLIEVVNQFNA